MWKVGKLNVYQLPTETLIVTTYEIDSISVTKNIFFLYR